MIFRKSLGKLRTSQYIQQNQTSLQKSKEYIVLVCLSLCLLSLHTLKMGNMPTHATLKMSKLWGCFKGLWRGCLDLILIHDSWCIWLNDLRWFGYILAIFCPQVSNFSLPESSPPFRPSHPIMAMSLEYRFTFINVLEEIDHERAAVLRRRSNSLPPPMSPTASCEVEDSDKKDGEYVSTLAEKLPFFGAQEEILPASRPTSPAADAATMSWSTVGINDGIATETTESTESEPESNFSRASNPGSVGHPELCRRPCIYFAAGQCRNSADCSFCHLSHAHRSATLDKNQRQMIKQLSKHEFLSVLLRCLRTKATQGQFEEDAKEVLELFEERLSQEPNLEASKVAAKVNNLERALARMTFFSVASLTTRAQFDVDFLERCKAAVGKLRLHLSWGPDPEIFFFQVPSAYVRATKLGTSVVWAFMIFLCWDTLLPLQTRLLDTVRVRKAGCKFHHFRLSAIGHPVELWSPCQADGDIPPANPADQSTLHAISVVGALSQHHLSRWTYLTLRWLTLTSFTFRRMMQSKKSFSMFQRMNCKVARATQTPQHDSAFKSDYIFRCRALIGSGMAEVVHGKRSVDTWHFDTNSHRARQ